MFMKKTNLIICLLFGLMLVLGVTNNVVGSILNSSTSYFEIFYFVCLAIGEALIIWSKRVPFHSLASIVIVGAGFGFNTLLWGIAGLSTGYSYNGLLNVLIAVMIFLSIIYFCHSYFKVFNLQKYIIAPTLILMILILILGIYVLATLDYSLSSNYVVPTVLSALSLLSCLGYP